MEERRSSLAGENGAGDRLTKSGLLRVRNRRFLASLAGITIAGMPLLCTAEPLDVSSLYEKSEHLVPMRDGSRLFTAVYRPKARSDRQPILLTRTPYSIEPYGPGEFPSSEALAPSDDFLREGYILVLQDVRGAYRSEGEWIDFRPLVGDASGEQTDERTDTWDTIEWLLENVPGHNGRVGLWGISYPGWYSVMGMLDPHPALKAVSPQATTADPFIGDDFHHNGAFIPTGVFWAEGMTIGQESRRNPDRPPSASIDPGTNWSYQFFLNAGPMDEISDRYFEGRLYQLWSDFIEHPDYDEYWQSRNFLEPLVDIRVPVLNVAGWFDEFDMYGAFATYQAIEHKNPRNQSILVSGPWRHGGWLRDDGASLGDIDFASKTSEYFKRNVVFPFFQHHLKEKGDWVPSEAIVFETGRNRWHRLDRWPPETTARSLFLRSGGRLSFEPAEEDGYSAHDSYVSDPRRPVPYTTEISMDEGYRWMVADQRYAYTRPDVLTWQSEPLADEITIAGPIDIELFAATSGTDSDWFVKLLDVYPHDAQVESAADPAVEMGGYQMMLGFEVMRGKYREDMTNPVPMESDAATPIRFTILDKYHTFRKGHRIMVQVQSSMFPFFDRNPQTFTNIYRATEEEYRKATQRVFRSRTHASRLILPVVN